MRNIATVGFRSMKACREGATKMKGLIQDNLIYREFELLTEGGKGDTDLLISAPSDFDINKRLRVVFGGDVSVEVSPE